MEFYSVCIYSGIYRIWRSKLTRMWQDSLNYRIYWIWCRESFWREIMTRKLRMPSGETGWGLKLKWGCVTQERDQLISIQNFVWIFIDSRKSNAELYFLLFLDVLIKMGLVQSPDKTFMLCLKILERSLSMMKLKVCSTRQIWRVKGWLLTRIFVLLKILFKH